jgi:hypothetical protein
MSLIREKHLNCWYKTPTMPSIPQSMLRGTALCEECSQHTHTERLVTPLENIETTADPFQSFLA